MLLAQQALYLALVGGLLALGQGASSAIPHLASSTSSSGEQVCGDQNTRLTICFPGSPDQATCVYSLTDNLLGSLLPAQALQADCPGEMILPNNCTVLPGTLYIAYGPCNVGDTIPELTAKNSKPVEEWLDILGINQLTTLGGLYVRGYAYQRVYDTSDVMILPELHSFKSPTTNQLLTAGYFQVAISGVAVPPMPKVEAIHGGISILNSPDVNFSSQAKFASLASISQGIRIAGCNSLTSLSGLENLVGGSGFANIEVINDLTLSDITALSSLFQCQSDGSTLLDPQLVVGTFGMHPPRLQPQNKGCTLHTPGDVCKYIQGQADCPQGTEYVRFQDGTIQLVPPAAQGTAASPDGDSATPAPVPSLD